MKILLTALPQAGKSTVIASVVEQFTGTSYGVVARELVDETGRRTGFTSVNSSGESRQFMFRSQNTGVELIGGEFEVDMEALDSFVVPELRRGLENVCGLIYIDEIGRAQARSATFLAVVREIFLADGNILAAIVYEDEPWSLEFKNDNSVCTLAVTAANRNALPDILLSAFKSNALFSSLHKRGQEETYELLRRLIASGQFIAAKKLFDNAIQYVVENRVTLKDETATIREYAIAGKTRSHRLIYEIEKGSFSCDCHLANGTGNYARQAQTCSHQLSVLIGKTR